MVTIRVINATAFNLDAQQHLIAHNYSAEITSGVWDFFSDWKKHFQKNGKPTYTLTYSSVINSYITLYLILIYP